MEHVPPPVELAFSTLHRMLKPDGLLLMTTPYNLGGQTREHFPELHQYTLASLGGRPMLINRRRDGSMETFENLTFHQAPAETRGGHGSALEMRVFTEASLRAILCGAGFPEVHFAAENFAEFGVEHSETWSLPIAARKGTFIRPRPNSRFNIAKLSAWPREKFVIWRRSPRNMNVTWRITIWRTKNGFAKRPSAPNGSNGGSCVGGAHRVGARNPARSRRSHRGVPSRRQVRSRGLAGG